MGSVGVYQFVKWSYNDSYMVAIQPKNDGKSSCEGFEDCWRRTNYSQVHGPAIQ